MNHLDEGTIHAWLDDAVDSTQSSEIEAHIAQCATCSAAVAEARGLVAGASRILNALDDVPANVVPKRAPAAGPVAPVPARRQWRAAPWVTGIAAALMLAIGLTQVNRKGAQENVFLAEKNSAAVGSSVADTATSRAVAASAPAEPREQTLSETVPPAAARNQAAATAPQERRDLARSERQIAITEDVRRVGLASDAAQTTGLRSATATGAGAAQTSPTQAAPAAPSQSVQNAPTQQKLDQVVAAAAPEALKSAVSASDVGADAKAQVERLAGCYRLDAPTRAMPVPPPASVGGVAGAVTQRAARGRAPASEAPASAAFAAPKAPGSVRLDTVVHPIGFLVRAERSDSILGWWRIAADSARLNLASGLRFVVARSDRVTCPDR